MHNIRATRESTEQRWRATLYKLWQQTDHLTDNYMRTAAPVLPYPEGDPEWWQARSRAQRSYEHMLRTLLDLPMTEDMEGLAQEVATAWASQERPLDVLMQVTHLDYKILWDALLWNTSKQDLPMLAVNADQVWSVVQEWSIEIQRAYVEAATALARERQDKQRDFVIRLMSHPDPAPQLVATTAAVLRLDIDGEFAVAAAPVAEREAMRAVYTSLRDGGASTFRFEDGEHIVLVVAMPDGGTDAVLGWLAGVRCALAPSAAGLARVPARAALANHMADLLPPHQAPRRLHELWDHMVGDDVRPWGSDLRTEVLGPLATRTDYEAQRLIETVREFANQGSVAATATALYCHRNTVINRLRVFRELTGHDMAIPRQAAAVVVALACRS